MYQTIKKTQKIILITTRNHIIIIQAIKLTKEIILINQIENIRFMR